MDGPDAASQDEEPILVVMWRGNRVTVFGDRSLRTTSRARSVLMGTIARAITEGETLDAILVALRASKVSETHDVELRVVDGLVQLWLHERH
jgi:hypothetical protein